MIRILYIQDNGTCRIMAKRRGLYREFEGKILAEKDTVFGKRYYVKWNCRITDKYDDGYLCTETYSKWLKMLQKPKD